MLKLKLKNNDPLNMSEKEDLEGTGTQSFLQPKEAGKTVKMTSENNPHALALDAAYGNDNPVDAKGNFSAVFGSASRAEGEHAFAQGTNTFAKGDNSHSEGNNAVAHGMESHAEGYSTLAQGDQSHAEGKYTISKGLFSHAEGYNTKAYGPASHAEGYNTVAGTEADLEKGWCAHASGKDTVAEASYSFTSGLGTVANTELQTVIGRYNKVEDSLFTVGCGTSNSDRENAFSVNIDGTIKFGQVTVTPISFTSANPKLIFDNTIQTAGGLIVGSSSTNKTADAGHIYADEITSSGGITSSGTVSGNRLFSTTGIENRGDLDNRYGKITTKSIESSQPCMASAVGASAAEASMDNSASILFTGVAGQNKNTFTCADHADNYYKNIFTGFCSLSVEYIRTNSSATVFRYQLPGIMYFPKNNIQTISLQLPLIGTDVQNCGGTVTPFASCLITFDSATRKPTLNIHVANTASAITKVSTLPFYRGSDGTFTEVGKIKINILKFD